MRHRHWHVPVAIAAITFAVFLPALRNEFVTWDDDKNFLENPSYRGLGLTELRWMWTTFHLGHYVPLSWMTLGLDYSLWGMNPVGYHLTSILIHCANAILVFFIAQRLMRFAGLARGDGDDAQAIPAAFAALVFSVHPLRVESVVWITERRDVLSGFFFFASVLAYLRWSTEEGSARRYASALALFACGLLAKGTLVTLPAVLVALNVYPLRRLGGDARWWSPSARRVWLGIAPFAVLSIAASLLTLTALQRMEQLDIGVKVAVASFSAAFYLWKTILPLGLAPLYEMPARINPVEARFLASYATVALVAVIGWRTRQRWPGLTAALAGFLIITAPMLGVVQNGPQIAADRYTYHAAPALALLAGACFARFWRPDSLRRRALMGAVVALLGVLTVAQTRVWRDSFTLWTHIARLQPRSAFAQNNLANLELASGRMDRAIDHFRRAVEIEPRYAEAHNGLGVALARAGNVDDAIAEYREALRLRPDYDEAESNWGIASAMRGELDDAIVHYRRAIAINPANADAHINLGNAFVRLSRTEEAIAEYQATLRLRPDDAGARLNWGVALARQGRFREAVLQFQMALAARPDHPEARQYLEEAQRLGRN